MDNVLINVENLGAAEAFFAELGMEVEGRTTVDGAWAGKVIGLDNVRADITMMKTPDGHGRVELSRFHTPPAVRTEPEDTPANALGLRRIMFAVEDVDDVLARLRSHGAELLDEIAQYENQVRLCFVRGPEGILIGLAEELRYDHTSARTTADVFPAAAPTDSGGPHAPPAATARVMNRDRAARVIEQLHRAQNDYYGGDCAALERLLAPDVVWTVPGQNRIAGVYRGIDEVLAYFARRRDQARSTFRMHRRDVLVGQTNRVAALTDGTATIDGRQHQWSTVGLYDINDSDQIAACWLLALDQRAFDTVWAS